MLTPRRIEIFKAIVDEYIRTAEPVGSKTLQQKYKLPYSSATIRNDMQVLEEMGYLEKTHTSSGRIPSTAGYKFYCENLLKDSNIDKKMEVAIRSAFDASNLNVQEAVEQSCQILSEMTNMTTGAVGPDSSSQRLEHIKLFPIDDQNAVAVFITNTGHTETKNFHFERAISIKDIETCTDVLNQRLKDVPVSELVQRMEELKPELGQVVEQHDVLFTAFVQAFVKFASENVYFSGKDKMLYQPEFEDISKLKKLMSVLDDTSKWKELNNSEHAVTVTTSKGAELTWVNDVAIVRSTFHVNKDEKGQLMVVGPSRMNYERVVSMLDYVAQMIEDMYRSGGDGKKK
ncbi:heat-inducible transcriptional repressor HrcA [Anaerolactibacter massiliensis]|jgi:heat-inducible transcriptional repressor|uniref:heat-inducible transcriptional repressor HrcA n=1 Tax=Anaerolactibacter massiliensis TaxID=2044573 RepID=UPI000CF94498|nr:heat-inducible transcriptional repressor HrcA [Anaerolactibacter massiliensis]MCI2154172.1 heat-inducible transcriptional repressor HrcA [Solobacterium sp.]MDD6366534.1 heat-inducible transcriptional repressor HrcA [Stecheria intestinalis]MDD7680321.1 heat-inducible transcriptional repressor HrcA [Stecheria intestinalis]MDY3234525.1 heat-inducible transcriptional repressor HrcA [Erysipelotrichaceae bacterium]